MLRIGLWIIILSGLPAAIILVHYERIQNEHTIRADLFQTKCREVGFTPAQCVFFAKGAATP